MEIELSPAVAHSTLEVMAPVLKISATERLKLAELIRRRQVPMSSEGRIPVVVIQSLLREVRSES